MYGIDMVSFTLQNRYTVIKHKHKTPDVTLKFNMELANDDIQKESRFPGADFQVPWEKPQGDIGLHGSCSYPFPIKVPKGNSAKALCLSVQLMRPSSSC